MKVVFRKKITLKAILPDGTSVCLSFQENDRLFGMTVEFTPGYDQQLYDIKWSDGSRAFGCEKNFFQVYSSDE